MKYRIVKLKNGKYKVQRKLGFLHPWWDVFSYPDDYPNYSSLEWSKHQECNDYTISQFSTIELAQKKIEKDIEERKQRKLKEKEYDIVSVVKQVSAYF